MKLLNCRRCDDVVKLVEDERSCECGLSHGRLHEGAAVTTGPVRLLAIDWETYDGMAPGETREFSVLPSSGRSA